MEAKTNLFGLDRSALRDYFQSLGEKPFRADQVMGWLYRRGERDFAAMTDVAKSLRARLEEVAEVRTPELLTQSHSRDGTRKWLLRLDGGNAIETVFIPEQSRGTLCISSQVGCALDCSFCATGLQGLNRNLSAAEIVSQVWFASHALAGGSAGARAISNVVFMGMGEPLANYRQVLSAINILLDDYGFGLSKRRVTVSTSGLVPFMDRLARDCDTALAVSLHAPNDTLRDELVPINRKYPLGELMAACRRYTRGKARRSHITYEYVMLDGVNDGAAEARQLAGLLSGLPAKVNLIPFNAVPGLPYKRSPEAAITRFQDELVGREILTTVRRPRGDDIEAACGQLAGRVADRQKRHLRRAGGLAREA
jgi:23S rRNA (adenine2503-C2)-methyltransferase